jgi:hypothetical protein
MRMIFELAEKEVEEGKEGGKDERELRTFFEVGGSTYIYIFY